VKKLHHLYKTLDKEEFKQLYYILTDVAYLNMEYDNESMNTVKINLKDIDGLDIGLGSSNNLYDISLDGYSDKKVLNVTNMDKNTNNAQLNRNVSFDSEHDTIQQENDFSQLMDRSMDMIPEPKLVEQIIEKPVKMENYYKWLFDSVMNSIPDDLLNINNINNQNMDVEMTDDINGYSNELTFNYFNSFN
jgi:hypothetical protein